MDDLKKHHDDDNRLTLSHPSIVKLDRMAFDFTESAQALQRDEKHLFDNIQRSISDLQDLMERRLDLSEEVGDLMKGVSEARQSDRDYALARTPEVRSVYEYRVLNFFEASLLKPRKLPPC